MLEACKTSGAALHAGRRLGMNTHSLRRFVVPPAIFLSTFVIISQNRADAKRQVIANEQWNMVKEEDWQNRDLLALSNQILELTKAVHAYASTAAGNNSSAAPGAVSDRARDAQ